MNNIEHPVNAPSDLQSAFKDAILTLKEQLIPYHESKSISWDHIRIELWEDTGRFIIFPASTKPEYRIDLAVYEIKCSYIEQEVVLLDKSNLSDDDYDTKILNLINEMAQVANKAFSTSALPFQIFDQDGQPQSN
jgi:hypothetical protein